MKRVSLFVFVAAVAVGCGGAKKPAARGPSAAADDRIATDSGAPSSLTADDILALYVEATGGRAAYEKLSSRVAKATMVLPSLGVKGDVEMYQQAPNKSYMKLVLGQAGTVEQGTDGTVVWERSAMTGVRVLSGQERELGLIGAVFNAELKYKELYKSVQLMGIEAVDGAPAYKLVFTTPSGQTETRYYDKDTKLLVKSSATVQHQMGKISSTTRYSDYRAVDGVRMPFKMEVSAMNQKRVLTLTDVKHNVAIPASRFALPPDVQKLLDK